MTTRFVALDFDEWMELAKVDPDAFELLREKYVRGIINQAGGRRHKKRLEGLQFQVDMIRRKAKNPLGSCIRISNLMHEHLYGKLMPYLNGFVENKMGDTTQNKPIGEVVPFIVNSDKDGLNS